MKTKVIFRKFRDDRTLVALFPEEPGTGNPNTCGSYGPGGHASACYADCIKSSIPAKPEEYGGMKRALEATPYNYDFEVVLRESPAMREKRRGPSWGGKPSDTAGRFTVAQRS